MCLQTHKYRIVYVQIIVPVLGPSPRQVANYTPSQLLKVAVISIYILFFFPGKLSFWNIVLGKPLEGWSVLFFSHLPPCPTPLGCHREPGWAPLLIRQIPAGCPILHMAMWMLQFCSLRSSHPLLPPLYPWVCSLCLCLHCCPTNRLVSTIFLDPIHMH